MTKKKKRNQSGPGLGGHRDGSGRKAKPDKDDYAQITVILRRETVEKLRTTTSKFGQFLQWHLDRHPLPTYDEYIELRDRPNVPTIVTVPTVDKPRQKRPQRPVDEVFLHALAKARKKRDRTRKTVKS